MVAIVRSFPIFTFQDETNLTRFVRVLIESEAAWHERFRDANAVKLAPAKLVSETMHSSCSAHRLLLRHDSQRRESQSEVTPVLYVNGNIAQSSFMRWKLIILITRALAAMIVGYAVIVALTSLGFNGVLGGRPLYGGSTLDLVGGMLVAIISGLVGGCIAGFVGPTRRILNAALVLVPLTGDTIFVLFFSKSTAPFWFDALASATLMACTVIGGLLSEQVGRRANTMA